jgi:hypothetical protein
MWSACKNKFETPELEDNWEKYSISRLKPDNKLQITNLCETDDDDDDEIVENGTTEDDNQVLIHRRFSKSYTFLKLQNNS